MNLTNIFWYEQVRYRRIYTPTCKNSKKIQHKNSLTRQSNHYRIQSKTHRAAGCIFHGLASHLLRYPHHKETYLHVRYRKRTNCVLVKDLTMIFSRT